MNELIYILMLILVAILSATSQVLLKLATKKKYNSFIFQYLNLYVIVAYAILALAIVLNIFVMRHINMSIVSVFSNSCPYILSIISGKLIFKEKISINKIIGAIIIIIGICFVVI